MTRSLCKHGKHLAFPFQGLLRRGEDTSLEGYFRIARIAPIKPVVWARWLRCAQRQTLLLGRSEVAEGLLLCCIQRVPAAKQAAFQQVINAGLASHCEGGTSEFP
jgi:hypothetical protein